MMTRFPLAYAPWELRDAARGPGAIMLALTVLIGFILTRMPQSQAFASEDVIRGVVNQSLFPLVLVVTAGMVSRDLSEGYYRSYFSRPVSPALFYLQRWLVGGLVLLLFIPALAAAVSIRTGEFVVPGWIVGRAALLYLLVGGTVFLLSTMIRRDWAIGALLYILETILHSLQEHGGQIGRIGRAIYTVLPPYHAGTLDASVTTGGIWSAVAYGVAIVLAALAIIRWGALGSGGRA